MLESIREGVKKPWVKIVIFAIVISFVFAGYFSSSFFLGDPNAVAIVNGESISKKELQRAYVNMKSQRADFYKANVKTEEDERNFQENILQQMITEKVRDLATSDMGLRLSNEKLRDVIQSNPNFQVEGKYSSAQLERTLAGIQMSRETLKSAFQTQETTKHLVNGLLSSEFSLEKETKADYELMQQRRTGRALQINIAPFKKNIEVTDEEVTKHYDDNRESFRVEEKVSVEYIELSVDKLIAMQSASEEQIESYYKENLDAFYKDEDKRQYSHILISSETKDAFEKIKALKSRIDSGEDFASIAKSDSEDMPTKDIGGDLGVLSSGDMEESFEAAANRLLNVGDVSEPIKSDFGYQLIKLTSFVKGVTKPLEEVKSEIVEAVKKMLAEEAFHAKALEMERVAFEVSDTLTNVATATGIDVQISPLIGNSHQEGIFANQALKSAAFSSDVKEGLVNSAPIEVGDNHLVVLRLKEHKPSEIQALEIVKQQIVSQLEQTKAKEKAEEIANSFIEKLETKQPIDELIKEHSLKWTLLDKVERNNASLSYFANQKFFQMQLPPKNEATLDKVVDFQGVTVLLLRGSEKGDWSSADEATRKQRSNYLSSYFANAGYSAFIEGLRSEASVTRNLSNLIISQ